LTSDTDEIFWTSALQTRSKVSADTAIVAWFADATVRCDLAVLAVDTGWTDAEVVGHQVDAFRVVLTRRSFAAATFDLAPLTTPAGTALATELGDSVDTRAVVETRVAGAFVDFDGAKLAGEAGPTLTLEPIDEVLTSLRSLATHVEQFAFVDVVFAVCAVETEQAGASVVGALVGARGVVSAGARAAVVEHMLAARAEEARGTLAHVGVVVVSASGIVHAWV
jgi:hypothetical protein